MSLSERLRAAKSPDVGATALSAVAPAPPVAAPQATTPEPGPSP